jgi:hypothetical protein
MIIAQRFNVGYESPTRLSPEGTAEPGRVLATSSAVPSGLIPDVHAHPTLKRWAIVGPSLRDCAHLPRALLLTPAAGRRPDACAHALPP